MAFFQAVKSRKKINREIGQSIFDGGGNLSNLCVVYVHQCLNRVQIFFLYATIFLLSTITSYLPPASVRRLDRGGE
jgi:hypothetical protein